MRMEPVRLAVFLSGSGSNFQAILDTIAAEKIRATVSLTVSSSPTAYGLERARRAGVPTHIVEFPLTDSATTELLGRLAALQVELILLAGFLKKIPDPILRAYPERILNIHPALLPDFGGKGMFGERVHRAVLQSGAKTSGATVHLVNERYDDGRILAQAEVPVMSGDTAATLAARVLTIEHQLFPRTIQHYIEQEFSVAPVA